MGLLPRPDAAPRNDVDLLGRGVPGLCNPFHELIVEGLQLPLKLLQLRGIEGARRRVHFGVLADAGGVNLRAELLVDTPRYDFAAEDSDRTGIRSGLRNDRRRRNGSEVAARG